MRQFEDLQIAVLVPVMSVSVSQHCYPNTIK